MSIGMGWKDGRLCRSSFGRCRKEENRKEQHWTRTLKSSDFFTLPKSIPHFSAWSSLYSSNNQSNTHARARYYTYTQVLSGPLFSLLVFLCVAMACSDCLFVCLLLCVVSLPSIEGNKSETKILKNKGGTIHTMVSNVRAQVWNRPSIHSL